MTTASRTAATWTTAKPPRLIVLSSSASSDWLRIYAKTDFTSLRRARGAKVGTWSPSAISSPVSRSVFNYAVEERFIIYDEA